MLIPIGELDDPRIEGYRATRDKDLAGRSGRFVVEGEVVLRVLLAAATFPIESVFLDERRVDSLREVLTRVPDVPVYVASQPLMSAIVGFPIHRGVLALARRPATAATPETLLAPPGPRLLVALEGIANHDNVGGIFRNAAAFGADGVLLDEASCDPLYRKAVRVSVGGVFRVPHARVPAPRDLAAELLRHGFCVLALTPAASAAPLDAVLAGPLGERVALLLGAEGPGLRPASLARATAVRIPMTPGFDSLNVAVASGIALSAARSALRRP